MKVTKVIYLNTIIFITVTVSACGGGRSDTAENSDSSTVAELGFDPATLIINEVLAKIADDEENAWIKLFNSGSEVIPLNIST